MVFARSIRDLEIWLFNVLQPSMAGVISHHHKMSPSQIVLEGFHGSHHCKQVLVGSIVPLLAGIQGFRLVSDNLNQTVIFLLLLF